MEEKNILHIQVHKNLEDTENILLKYQDMDILEFSEWTKEKSQLRYNSDIPKFPIYNNFLYWCNLGTNIGSEQNKLRPVLIVRTERKSPICTIIPLTTKKIKDARWYHIDLENQESTALVEQLRVVSKIRIVKPYRKKGQLIAITQDDWDKINFEIKRLYQLRDLKNNK